MKLPDFNERGFLPVGTYKLTFSELYQSPLVLSGPNHRQIWNVEYRRHLLKNFELLSRQLWLVGIEDIWIGGSFVENNPAPGDIDGFFLCEPSHLLLGRLENELQALGQTPDIWTWSEASARTFPGNSVRKLPMWERYRVELFPYYVGMESGLTDQYGQPSELPTGFRLSRRRQPKGIVKLVKD